VSWLVTHRKGFAFGLNTAAILAGLAAGLT
jgi:hypothetical protein